MEQRLNQLLRLALKYNVTDIHFSYEPEHCVIEMRQGGTMKRIHEKKEDARFFRYLLYRANLNLSTILRPQTGRFTQVIDGTRLDLRFSVITSLSFMSGVLRILNNHPPLTTSLLSANPKHIPWFQTICQHRSGFYVFSGPTGSGKTTTLYTILNEVEGKKIYTLEDPIEVYSNRYVQLAINDAQHLSYSEGIKQLMRHDPDIVMIGEIRDEEAAKMAVRCALTGHLVLTSIHSSSCLNAIHRLLDLGVNEMELSDILYGISNQRLYETKDRQKIGVYEIMNRKEVSTYFKTHQTSERFSSLEEEIRKAIQSGIIEAEVAKQDLL